MASSSPVTKFIVSDFGDKVDSGTGLSYLPARLLRLAGRFDNPYAGVNYAPYSGTMNLATDLFTCKILQLGKCNIAAAERVVAESLLAAERAAAERAAA
jgi:hypothetical protein